MQFFEPLAKKFNITAFGSEKPYHDSFAFPVVKLPSPMDSPEFPYKMSVLNRLFVDAHYLHRLEGALKGFDLVHTAETYFRYTQQCLNAKRKGYVKKVIATVLENIPHNNEGIWGRKKFKSRARSELDHMIALTRKTKEALILEGADESKISVISHFVDTGRFKPSKEAIARRASNTKNLAVLFTGRLEEHKGVLDILEVARLLVTDEELAQYSLTFLFVGDGSRKSTMENLIHNWNLQSNIQFESVSYDEMPSVYERGDIFVAPSKPTKTWEEQYCTALLEAQATALPIVTTRSGGIPENVGSAGVLVSPGNVGELRQALKEFIINPRKRKKYALVARQRAEKVHDISIGARKIGELYKKILESN